MKQFRYRVTGPQSIDRLCPLLPQVCEEIEWLEYGSEPINSAPVEFIWETTCEKTMSEIHKTAVVINRLSNTHIIENKANLAFLQLRMPCPTLDTYIAGSAKEVLQWANQRWGPAAAADPIEPQLEATVIDGTVFRDPTRGDWWAVKASKGNGGKDVWIMNAANVEEVMALIPANEEFVIQRYVQSPMLWNGRKKFHFRCYSALMADMSALVYGKAYALTASLDFDCSSTDSLKHITNLSVNKATHMHPGQIPCDLAVEFPQCLAKYSEIWAAVATAATPFMTYQRSKLHFEFFGVDIIADSLGGCWMIEANRLPGLESSNNNKTQEDEFYNAMMLELLGIVLQPIIAASPSEAAAAAVAVSGEGGASSTGQQRHWLAVKGAREGVDDVTVGPDAATFKNLFAWRLFTKGKKSAIVL